SATSISRTVFPLYDAMQPCMSTRSRTMTLHLSALHGVQHTAPDFTSLSSQSCTSWISELKPLRRIPVYLEAGEAPSTIWKQFSCRATPIRDTSWATGSAARPRADRHG